MEKLEELFRKRKQKTEAKMKASLATLVITAI